MRPEVPMSMARTFSAGTLIRPVIRLSKVISSGLIDSFHLVDLALFVEDRFGVRIDDTELNADTFDTLEQLVELIHQRQ